jgi:hypothetical protein
MWKSAIADQLGQTLVWLSSLLCERLHLRQGSKSDIPFFFSQLSKIDEIRY